VVASRHHDRLQVRQATGGDNRTDEHQIDGLPWYQPLSLSLRSFLQSPDDLVSFWSIRQDTLEPVKLTAHKTAVESLSLGDEPRDAFKIIVRPAGLLAPFWRGTYWYDRSNGLFLQYRGVNGLPGTPETVIRIESEPAA
jgi:hypothetical protein